MIKPEDNKPGKGLNWWDKLMEEWRDLEINKRITLILSLISFVAAAIFFIYKNIFDLYQTFPRFLVSLLIVIILLGELLAWGLFFLRKKEIKIRIITAFLGTLTIIILVVLLAIPRSRAGFVNLIASATPTPTVTATPLQAQSSTPVPTAETGQTLLPTNTLIIPPTQAVAIPTAAVHVKGAPTASPFYIYKDAGYGKNFYFYSGVMGDIGDITVNESYIPDETAPSETWIEVTYQPAGKGDVNGKHSCPLGEVSDSMCTWAGAYWLDPADNFGAVPVAGYDLSAYSNLKFFARAKDQEINVKFLVGGVGWSTVITPPYPDSMRDAATTGWVHLTQEWKEYSIGLLDSDRSHVIGGFGFIVNWSNSGLKEGDPARVFYINEIRFEK